jgi:transposase-like protein
MSTSGATHPRDEDENPDEEENEDQQEGEAKGPPRKMRARRTIREKATILKWMEDNGKSLEETAEEYDLSVSTLAKWRMRKHEMLDQANSMHANMKACHAPKYPELETKVLAWVNAAADYPPSRSAVEQFFHQAKEQVLAEMANVEEMSEHEISRKRKLEKLTVSPEFVSKFFLRNKIEASDSPAISRELVKILPALPAEHTAAAAASSWDARIAAVEQQWGVSSPPASNRKVRIEAVEKQVFGRTQERMTLDQRLRNLE